MDDKKFFSLKDFDTTAEIAIPQDPLCRVIGQDEAVELARIAAMQKRHFLLVGPPGTGKSMIAQALSLHLPRPTEEIRVVHNPEKPERPVVEIKKKDEVYKERESREFADGELISPNDVPIHVAENLGYRCVHCGFYSSPREKICSRCSKPKSTITIETAGASPFADIVSNIFEGMGLGSTRNRVTTTQKKFGKEEVVAYERAGEMIRKLDQKALEHKREMEKLNPRKVLVPLERNPFVLATGASETELLGDVRHDPFGGHPQLGVLPYERVVPGAIHEAHEGVLFIDELSHLGHLQRYILTAMQEKRFPISGRNPQSAGASVKVENVPCDFIFVGACNIQELHTILSPLRSRISGCGYEILLETTMEDNELNRAKIAQFVAQEIAMDRKIPHATRGAVLAIIEEARRRAKVIDKKEKALTLRLRELGGLIRTAGDLAIISRSEFIEEKHIRAALKRSRTIEEQIRERHGSYTAGLATDVSGAQREMSPQYYWNVPVQDDKSGYW